MRKGRDPVHHPADAFVHVHGPFERGADILRLRMLLQICLKAVVAQGAALLHIAAQRGQRGRHEAALLHLAAAGQQVQRLEQGEQPVNAAEAGIEVDEIPCVARIARYGLQMEMLDGGRTEALLVLDLHGVENASVRIDADQKGMGGGKGFLIHGAPHSRYSSNAAATPSSVLRDVTLSAAALMSSGALPIATPTPHARMISRSLLLSPMASVSA